MAKKWIDQTRPRKTPTFKQKRFAQEYVRNGGNGVKAAQKVYNSHSYDGAKAIAVQNMDKPMVQNEIEKNLVKAGLSSETLGSKLATVIDTGLGVKATNKDALAGIITAYKLLNAFPEKISKRLTVAVSRKELIRKDITELKEDAKKITEKTSKLVADLSSYTPTL